MLIDDLKAGIKKAMLARDEASKDILRVALGEIQTLESRAGKPLTDDESQKVLRKLITSNEESIASCVDPATSAKLNNENVLLSMFLPKQASMSEVEAQLIGDLEPIKAAKSDGQATGLAMKSLKAKGVSVDGKMVTEVVKKMRLPVES